MLPWFEKLPICVGTIAAAGQTKLGAKASGRRGETPERARGVKD